MTPQEQQLLQQLAQRINQTRLTEKDPDAENLLGKELGANSDALYILAQTVLVQDLTLQRANSHIADLEQQIGELQQQLDADEQEIGELQAQTQQRAVPAKSTSFLGRIFGEQPSQQSVPQLPPYQPVQPQYQQNAPAYQPVQQYAPPASQPQYVPTQPQYIPAAPMGGMSMGGSMMGGQPSFLQGAMQTAAGVAAGTLAVEGVESLIHGFGHHEGYGGGYGMGGLDGGFGGERPREEIINNYYGDDREREHHEGNYDSGFGGEEHSHHEGARFADTGNDTYSNDNFADPNLNSELDNTGNFTDSGSYDDSSNYDDNSGF